MISRRTLFGLLTLAAAPSSAAAEMVVRERLYGLPVCRVPIDLLQEFAKPDRRSRFAVRGYTRIDGTKFILECEKDASGRFRQRIADYNTKGFTDGFGAWSRWYG